MLKVASFALPKEEDKANEFLATHKVASTSFNKDMIVVFVEDGIVTPAMQIADLREYLRSMEDAQFQQQVSLHVMEEELKGLNAKRNKPRFDDITSAIANVKAGIANQEIKKAFVEKRIKALSK